MNGKSKSNSIVTTGYADGKWTWTVAGVGMLSLDRAAVHEAILDNAMIEGMSDRVVDKAALGFNKAENRYATPREKFDAMRGLVEHYASGSDQWSMRAATPDNSAITMEAILRVKGADYTMEMVEAFVNGLAEKSYGGDRKACLNALAKGARVGEAILAIRQERLGEAAVNADALLDDMA